MTPSNTRSGGTSQYGEPPQWASCAQCYTASASVTVDDEWLVDWTLRGW